MNKTYSCGVGTKDLDDLIWMSYRYCIGRHTAAACMHADTIYQLVEKYHEQIGSERINFYADDILDCVDWNRHLNKEGEVDYDLDYWEMTANQLKKNYGKRTND